MNLLDTLTRAADEEQLRLKPLPEHAAATQEEHLRRHYALLLAAVLTAQPTVSEPQTRLLRLLLDALKLGDMRGPLFEQARELEPETLLEAARLIREAGFAHHLVVDTLVLLRLDAPLGDEAARLVGELAAFLGLDESGLATRAQDAGDILGLNPSLETEKEGCADLSGKEEAAGDDVEAPSLQAELWPGRLSQPLTAAALRKGLQGGLWLLDANLDVGFPWQANDAILFFRNGATLNTFAKEGQIKLADCRLVDAALAFQGACSVTLERCVWRGNYAPEAECTALNSNGPALNVHDCEFSTRNARAIAALGNELTLTESRFTHCGHEGLNGGAVRHSDHGRIIRNCLFDRCLAAHGGAIFVGTLRSVEKCEFVACRSVGLQGKSAGDVAVYAKYAAAPTAISGCVFRQTSLVIGDAYAGSNAKFVCSTRFQQGNVYYHHRYSHSQITYDCSFVDGREIEREF
jgi:hypothetical protein